MPHNPLCKKNYFSLFLDFFLIFKTRLNHKKLYYSILKTKSALKNLDFLC